MRKSSRASGKRHEKTNRKKEIETILIKEKGYSEKAELKLQTDCRHQT